MEEHAEQYGLKKTLGFFPALSTVMGTVIGAGVFFKAAAVTTSTGTSSMAMFAWFLGGIITICAGLTAAELAAAFPEAGGMTRYIERTYGHFWGFLAGWAQAVIAFPANIAAIAIAFGTQFTNLFGLNAHLIVPIAMLTALSLLLINWISARAGGWVTSVALVVKLIPLALIVLLGFFHSGGVDFSLFPVVAGAHLGFWTALGNGLLATMFAYDGWMHVGNIAGEMKNPKKDLPRAIALGIGLVMVVYLLVNAVFLFVEPVSRVAGNLNVAADVAKIIFGGVGGKFITIGILVSVYGGLNGYIMTGMRIPYVMGVEHKLPFGNAFASLNRAGVPWFAGLAQYAIAFLMMLSGAFDAITNMLVFVVWIFYCMSFAAVMILRRRQPELLRPYKVPLYPWIPLVALIGGVFILVNTVFTQFTTTAIGIVVTLLGIPFYYYLNKKWHFTKAE
ncbi:APC family permease [Furfurilactobacillus sp. WILCCON 0119]